MLKQSLRLITPGSLNVFSVSPRHETYCTISSESTKKWDLLSAVCLERHPIITRPMNEIEKEFQECLSEIEFENSYKSNHELRIEREEREKKTSTILIDESEDTKLKLQSVGEYEDACQLELESFKFAPRTTEADEKNITNTFKRKLDKTLLFITEQKLGNTFLWQPPQGIRNDGETMRQAAERVLRDTCGSELTVQFYGNAPIGYYKYLYPKAARTEKADGAKVFFYLARYVKGNVSDNVKHQWLDRAELTKVLERRTRRALSQFLLPD